MNKSNKIAVAALFSLVIAIAQPAGAQEDYSEIFSAEIPGDFKVVALAGGVAGWTPLYRIELDSKGEGVYSVMAPERRIEGVFVEVDRFKLEEPALRFIYEAIKINKFFELKNSYIATNILDGSFAELTITENGKTHKVRTQNMAVERFDNIMRSINIATPEGDKVLYNEILR